MFDLKSPQFTLPKAPTGGRPSLTLGGIGGAFKSIGSGLKSFFTPRPRQKPQQTNIGGLFQGYTPFAVPTSPLNQQSVAQTTPQSTPVQTTASQTTTPQVTQDTASPVQISINTPQQPIQQPTQEDYASQIPTPISFQPTITQDGYVPSSTLASNTTYQDVLEKRNQYEEQYRRALKEATDVYGQGLQAVENARYSGETSPFAQGQTERTQRNADLASLAATNRAEAAGKLLDINQQNLTNALAQQPTSLGTQINQATGDVYVTTRNPVTGATEVVNAGNIGAQKSFVSSSVNQDPATKQLVFTGIRPDGSVETKVLSGGVDTQPGGVLSALPTSVQTKLISIANDFGGTDIVKRFNSTVDGINLVNSISANSKNPSDHQTIVYAFAKSLDPDSVVREGEYATIKKYSQSTISAYGKEIANALNGTGFLSTKAIQNIKKTMNNNYQSRKPVYDNLYNQKSRIINNLAGADVAKDVMIDYSQGATAQSSGQNVIQTKVGAVDNSWFN